MIADPLEAAGFRKSPGLLVYGTFLLDGDEYGIVMDDLQEVVDAPARIQRMPLAPPYLLGLAHLRGHVTPVVDLRVLLKVRPRDERESSRPARMAVLRRGSALIGVLFDALGEVLRVAPGETSPIRYDHETDGLPVRGVICRDQGRRMIQILDLPALLSVKNMPAIGNQSGVNRSDSLPTAQLQNLQFGKLIGFTIGGCAMALEMKCLVSILESSRKRASPRQSALCHSVVTLQGRDVPVVRTAELLRLEGGAGTRILVCQSGESWVGFEVDEVTTIIPYSRAAIQPIPVLQELKTSLFRGCFTDRAGKDFIVLDEAGLLARPEIRELIQAHEQLTYRDPNRQEQTLNVKSPVLAFRLGKLFGLKLADVVEVVEWKGELTRTPDMPTSVLGILSLRGTPVPIIDPRPLFRLPPPSTAEPPRILIFQDQGRKIGMQVDSVESILSLSLDQEHGLPDLLFRAEKDRFADSFSQAIPIEGDHGKRSAIVLLQTSQIVERLASALAP